MQKIYVKPKDYWMNDPNGFIYYKGMYHLFYQCFPYPLELMDDIRGWLLFQNHRLDL